MLWPNLDMLCCCLGSLHILRGILTSNPRNITKLINYITKNHHLAEHPIFEQSKYKISCIKSCHDRRMRKCLPWALLPLASQLWGVVADAHPAAAVGERHRVAQVEFVTAHAALRLEVMVERLGPRLR